MRRLAAILFLSLSALPAARALVSASVSAPSPVNVNQSYTVNSSGSDDAGTLDDLIVTKNGQYLDSAYTQSWMDGSNYSLSLSDTVTAPGSTGTTTFVATVDTDTYTTTASCTVTVITNHAPVPSVSIDSHSSGSAVVIPSGGSVQVTVRYKATDQDNNLSGIRPQVWNDANRNGNEDSGEYFFNNSGYFVTQSGGSGEVDETVTLNAAGNWYFWTDSEDSNGATASTSAWASGFKLNAVSNNAAFVSQSVPAVVYTGQTFAVSQTWQNSGSSTWDGSTNDHLGAQNPQDNNTWGNGRYATPSNVTPGSNTTYTFNLTSPATAGTYNFQSRMVEDGVEWFGAFSTNVAIHVANPLTATLSSSLGGVFYTGQSTNFTAAYNVDTAHGDALTNTEIKAGASVIGSNGGVVTSLVRSWSTATPGTYAISAWASTTGSGGNWLQLNPGLSVKVTNPPTATLTSSLGNTVYYGQTTTLTAAYSVDTAHGDALANTEIEQGSTPLGGAGGAVTSLTRSWLANTSPGGNQQFNAQAQTMGNGSTWGTYASLTLTVAKAKPNGTFLDKNVTLIEPTYTIASGDLNSSWANPYSTSVTAPLSAPTYTLTDLTASDTAPGATYPAIGSTLTAGTHLYAGTYHILATYPGSTNYTSNTTPSTWVIADPAPVNVAMTAPNISYGQTATFTATATDANGDLIEIRPWIAGPAIAGNNGLNTPAGQPWDRFAPTGTYAFSNSGNQTVSGPITSADFTTPLVPGVYSLSMNSFDGVSWTYNPSNIMATFTVSKATPVLKAETFSGRSVTGTTYTLTTNDDLNAVFIHQQPSSAVAPTGLVTYAITSANGSGATPLGPVADQTVLQEGRYEITAYYPGDANYNAFTAKADFIVSVDPVVTLTPNTAQTIAFGQAVTFSSTATDSSNGMDQHNFTWQLPDGPDGTWSTAMGNLTSTGAVNTFSPVGTDTRSYTFTPIPVAGYNGGSVAGNWSFKSTAHNAAGTGDSPLVTVTVNKATLVLEDGTFTSHTVTALTGTNLYTVQGSDLNAAFANPYNSAVTQPSGTVTYAITAASGPYASPTGPVAANTTLRAGTYTIAATYPGDANYILTTPTRTLTLTVQLDPSATPFNDGVTNGQKTALGMNPYQAASNGASQINLKVNTPHE